MNIAGVDEVGRGALFGPVVAAAAILPDEVLDELVACGFRIASDLVPNVAWCWRLKLEMWP